MDVDGISVAKAKQIEDASVVSGYVNDAGNLVLVNAGGSEINAGPIRMLGAWPVGSIFIATVATSPVTLLGGGTWERFGKGKVLLSLDENDTQFDTVLETGGEKTHKLTQAELPKVHGEIQAHASLSHWWDPSGVFVGSPSVPQFASPVAAGSNFSSLANLTLDFGSDAAHNNLQPFVVVFMWLRTA